ncbi:MAG: sugar phosphate nucleotidyltransferase [Bernardetiaceae bacterium]
MNIIIPMAGRGSRLRPHTLTLPKPLIPIAGKPVVQRLVEDIAKIYGQSIDNVAFVIGDFGAAVEAQLLAVAEQIGAKGHIFYQDQPLGTAHAIACAAPFLAGNVIVAFADTLFRADFTLDTTADGVIWVKQVENPEAFGVVKYNEENVITDFVEKSPVFVSDLAIIGIYYFREGEKLRQEIEAIIREDIKDKGEYQITTALDRLKNKGARFIPGSVEDWLDCGNKNVVVQTNGRYLDFIQSEESLIDDTATIENSVIIPPVFIGAGAHISASIIGPHVSVGARTRVERSVLSDTLIQEDSHITAAHLQNTMVGNKARYVGKPAALSIGDFSEVE